jgi:hypothetical protein
VEDEGARSAPPRHNLVELEDAEEDDVLETKKNKKRSDGANMTKDKIKKQGEAATFSQDRCYDEVQRIVDDEDFGCKEEMM